jgi:hypothetical protein
MSTTSKVLWGKFQDDASRFVRDAPLPTSVAQGGVSNIPAQRKLIASFPGTGFVAEREEGELRVYLVSNVALPTNLTGDRAPCGCGTRVGAGSSMDAGRTTAEAIQRRSEEMRKSRAWG